MNTASFAVADLEGALVGDVAESLADLLPRLLLGPHLKRDLSEQCALERQEGRFRRLDLAVAKAVTADGSDVGGQGRERCVEGVGHELSVGLNLQALKVPLETASWVDDPSSVVYVRTHRNLKVKLETGDDAHSYRTQSAGDPHNKTNGLTCDSYIAGQP